MARNDIEHAMWKAAEANEAEGPEFDYWVRLVMGHFLEAAEALENWRRCSRSRDGEWIYGAEIIGRAEPALRSLQYEALLCLLPSGR